MYNWILYSLENYLPPYLPLHPGHHHQPPAVNLWARNKNLNKFATALVLFGSFVMHHHHHKPKERRHHRGATTYHTTMHAEQAARISKLYPPITAIGPVRRSVLWHSAFAYSLRNGETSPRVPALVQFFSDLGHCVPFGDRCVVGRRVATNNGRLCGAVWSHLLDNVVVAERTLWIVTNRCAVFKEILLFCILDPEGGRRRSTRRLRCLEAVNRNIVWRKRS